MVLFVEFLAQKRLENGFIVACVYAGGILFGLALKTVFLELATGFPLGGMPTRLETKIFRALMYAFVCAPHAVFFAWSAHTLGWTGSMPQWWLSGISLVVLVSITWMRSHYRALRPVTDCACDLADQIDMDDPVYQQVATEVKNGQLLEAIKVLRHIKGLDTQCAIHTVRKIRVLTSRAKRYRNQ